MMTVFIKLKELKSLDFIYTVFFCLKNWKGFKNMIIITIIFYYLVITVVLIIITSYLKRWLRKYIEKRINQNLELLNRLENINKELDSKIDSVKIKMYDVYLDRCRESLKKKRKMDKEIRQLTQKIKNKIAKNGNWKRYFGETFLGRGSGESRLV